MPRLSRTDKVSLEYVLGSIQRVLPMIQDNSIYEYLLNVYSLLDDLEKGRGK